MPKFIVALTRDCTESTNIDVDAISAEGARYKALAEARLYPQRFDWVRDEGSGDSSAPYISAEENAVVEVPDAEV